MDSSDDLLGDTKKAADEQQNADESSENEKPTNAKGNDTNNSSSDSDKTSETTTTSQAKQTHTSASEDDDDDDAIKITTSSKDNAKEATSSSTSSSSSKTKDADAKSASSTSSEEGLKLKSSSSSDSDSESAAASDSTRMVSVTKSSGPGLSGSPVKPGDLVSASASADSKDDDNTSTVGTIAGVATVGVICIIALIAFILWKKRQHARRTVKPRASNDDSDEDFYSVHEFKPDDHHHAGPEKSAMAMRMRDFPDDIPPVVPPRTADPFLATPHSPASPWMHAQGQAYGHHSHSPSMASFHSQHPPQRGLSPSPSLSPYHPHPHQHPQPGFASPYPQQMPGYDQQQTYLAASPYDGMGRDSTYYPQQQQQHHQGQIYMQHPEQPPPPSVSVSPTSHLISQPTPFRPMSTDWVQGGPDSAARAAPEMRSTSPSELGGDDADTIRGGARGSRHMSLAVGQHNGGGVRDSRYTSGFSMAESENRISTSAFPVPPPPISEEGQHRETSSSPAAQDGRQSAFIARPVSQVSDTSTFATATSDYFHQPASLVDEPAPSAENNSSNANKRFFLPPLQIPNSAQEVGLPHHEQDAAENLDLPPPTRPFASSATDIEVAPRSGGSSPRSGSPLARVGSPLRAHANPSAGHLEGGHDNTNRDRSATLTKNPFVLDNEEPSSATTLHAPERDSFDITGNYFYKREEEKTAAPAEKSQSKTKDRPESTEVLSQGGLGEQLGRQRSQSRSSLSEPGRVSGSDWGFLDSWLDPSVAPAAEGSSQSAAAKS